MKTSSEVVVSAFVSMRADRYLGDSFMSTTPFIVDDSVGDSRASLWFAAPASFVELPMEAFLVAPDSNESGALFAALIPLVEAIPAGVSRQQLIGQIAGAQQLFLALNEVGTVHCSLGVHRDDAEGGDGRILVSMLTVSWRDIAWSPRAVSAARAVATAEGHTHIEYLELPCGPASISETIRTPADNPRLPREPLLQVCVHLPFPDGKRMAIFVLSTTAVHRREQYRAILQQIAQLVSFENPLPG
ncbi:MULTISPECIES: hypothetical protein [Streptomyces]|uniref:hypothetical protein n=1 Tax=Streptomyces TaxID=1883 RepID=UPI0033E1DF4D